MDHWPESPATANDVTSKQLSFKKFNNRMRTYFVVRVLPKVECDELKGVEHRPAKVVEVRVAEARVFTNIRKTCVVSGTISEDKIKKHSQMLLRL